MTQINDAAGQDIIIGTKVPRHLSRLDPKVENQKALKSAITQREVNNFEFVGINAILQLQKIYPVPDTLIHGVQIQMAIAITFLTTAYFFPITMPILGPLAGIILSEAITDIAMALIDRGYEAFNKKEYLNGKLISYAISVCTFGLNAAAHNIRVVMKALSLCRSMTRKLNKINGPFAKVCQAVCKHLKKLEQYLETSLKTMEFTKKTQLEKVSVLNDLHQRIRLDSDIQEYYKLYRAMNFAQINTYRMTPIIKQSFTGAIKGVVISLALEKMLIHTLHLTMEALKPRIEKEITEVVSKKFNTRESMIFSSMQSIEEAFQCLLNVDLGKDIENLTREIALGVLRNCEKWKIQTAILLTETSLSMVDIITFTDKICDQFLLILKNKKTKCNAAINPTFKEGIIHKISQQIRDILYNKLIVIFSKVIITIPQITYKGYQQYKSGQEKQKHLTQIGKNIQEANHANSDANCTLQALATLYDINIRDVIHAFGFITTPKGASLGDVKQILTNNRIDYQECGLEDLDKAFNKMGSDKALAFFKKDYDLGHVISINSSEKIHEFIKKYACDHGFTSCSFIVPFDLKEENLALHQQHIKNNRLINATRPLVYGGKNEDPAYGVEQTRKRKKDIKESHESGEKISPRDAPRITKHAIYGSGNDELLQTSKFAYWEERGLKAEFYYFRVPTEELIWVIQVGQDIKLAGHSGALRRTDSPQAFVTNNQAQFHNERTRQIQAFTDNPAYKYTEANSYKVLSIAMDYTIRQTAGKNKINEAFQKNSNLFLNLSGTNGDLCNDINRKNFMDKNQVARDIKKLIVEKADEMSGQTIQRKYSLIVSHNHSFFQQQSEAIKQAKTPEDLGRVAMNPTPYAPC